MKAESLSPATPTRLDEATVERAIRHLSEADAVMARLIPMVGPFALRLKRGRFETLVRSIISQQISTSAANSIRAKLQRALGGAIRAEVVAAADEATLRGAGLSTQKIRYLRDLSERVACGDVRLRGIHRLDDVRVIEELTQVKGIGEWTAQMFLMFHLGRPDVFPHGDLGIQTALRNLYGLRESRKRERAERIAARWRPYSTVASWYCWRSLELEKSAAGQWC